jgi:ABC-type multidrug transport system fused ATPase/permease subunit
MASEVTGSIFDFSVLRRTLRYAKPYLNLLYGALFLTLLISVFSTARPLLVQYAMDHFVIEGGPQAERIEQLGWIIAIMIGVLVAESITTYFSIFLTNLLGQEIIEDIRKELYAKIVGFQLKYFDRNPIGTLVTRAVSDIETIANVFSEGIVVIFGDLFKLVVTVVVMFAISWKLAIVSLLVFPFLLFATRVFQRSIKRSFQDVRTQIARLNAFVQEHITGMNIVQIFNREKREMEKFKEINRLHMDANIRSIWYFSIFLPVVELSSAVAMGLLVWYGGMQAALPTDITLGDLIAFILFVNMLFRPVRQLADRFNTLQMGVVSSDRVFKVIDTDSHIENRGTYEVARVEGQIKFDAVQFAYIPGEPVLRGITFEAKPRQTNAIVGATGAGKTSVVNLISRFYEIQSGTILLDGRSIQDFELSNLRSQIAVVLQDVFLFSDTIYNNITLKQDIPLEEVRKAAKFIGVDDFIQSLPGGYSYSVGERGAVLSAGQRQLIAFLRAYMANPSILIMDEATSSVDTHTEELIQLASEKLMMNRTSIVIAHRLATIQRADQILVLDKGNIVERGQHQELLDRGGVYKSLYDLQFVEHPAEQSDT